MIMVENLVEMAMIKRLINIIFQRGKGKISTIRKEVLYQDLLTQSDAHIPREHYDSALRDLQEDDYLIVTDQVIRVLSSN